MMKVGCEDLDSLGTELGANNIRADRNDDSVKRVGTGDYVSFPGGLPKLKNTQNVGVMGYDPSHWHQSRDEKGILTNILIYS